jgi:hypothetical protein
VNPIIAVLVVIGTTVLTVTAMLLVRRRAPEGSYFADGDRASGVFGVIATGFAVLLGFIVFLAFQSYDAARSGAETEALVVGQQVETAQLLPEESRAELTADLVCYARSVAGVQWEKMENGTLGDAPNPWGVELFQATRTLDPKTATEQSAYDAWISQTMDREAARNDRIHGAVGVIPTPLWIALFVCAATIFGYMLFFADSGERATTQAALMGSVTIVITSLFVLLVFLDNPFHRGIGGLRPVAMTRAVRVIDEELKIGGLTLKLPCDLRGVAR